MKKAPQFIRQGMIQGVLPIGSVFKKEGSSQYDYYIYVKGGFKVYDSFKNPFFLYRKARPIKQ